MPELTQIRFQRLGPVARLTFNRPQNLNALTPTLIAEALAVVEEVAASDARVLVVTGEGRSFSVGVDLKVGTSPDYTKEVAKRFTAQAQQLGYLFSTMPQATIARIAGNCFTGGMELALACDLAIAADDAVFCDTHAKLGLSPHWGLTQRLSRLIGAMKAREMSFTARRVPAPEALAMGMILDAVPADQLDARVDALVEALVANSGGSIAAYKTLYRASQTMNLDEGLAFEGASRFKIADRAERIAALAGGLKKGG